MTRVALHLRDLVVMPSICISFESVWLPLI